MQILHNNTMSINTYVHGVTTIEFGAPRSSEKHDSLFPATYKNSEDNGKEREMIRSICRENERVTKRDREIDR